MSLTSDVSTEEGRPRSARGTELDLQTETALVVPLSGVVVLVLLAAFGLVARYVVGLVIEERETIALRQSAAWLESLDVDGLQRGVRLQAPAGAQRALLLDREGMVRYSSESETGWNASLPLTGALEDDRPGAAGRADLVLETGEGAQEAASVLVTVHRVSVASDVIVARVDWPAREIGTALRVLDRATFLGIALGLTLAVMLAFYWRRRLRLLQGLIGRLRGLEEGTGQGASLSAGAEATRLLTTFDELIHRLRAEDENPLRDAFAGSPDLASGLLLLDRRGQVLAVNETGAQWLGVPLPVPVGSSCEVVLRHQPAFLDLLRSAMAREDPIQRAQVDLRGADGEVGRSVGLTFSPLRRGGEVSGWFGLFADLTGVQEQQRSQVLSQSLGQLAEMSAGLAHELRNGVASLKGFAELLARSSLQAEQREDLAEMRREIDSLHRISEDFLSFARPGTARRERVDLAQVLQSSARDPSFDGLQIACEAPDRDLQIDGDPALLERAFRNLIANAYQSQQRAGVSRPVEVEIARRDDRIVIVVADRGEGLPEDRGAADLFTPFVRGAGGDTGLGLALTRRIVELHGGSVQLNQRADGSRGAVAEVSLPAQTLP